MIFLFTYLKAKKSFFIKFDEIWTNTKIQITTRSKSYMQFNFIK